MDKLVAITGGIGSGKSTVSKIISDLGYKVFSADKIYKDLIKDKEFVKSIYNALEIESKDLVFDKDLISNKVFNNKDMLNRLNSVTHPVVMDKMLLLSKRESGVVFNEVPLLFEGGYERLYDKVIIVCRDLDSRVDAVSKRDNVTKEKVLLKINNQINYEKFLTNEHTLIVNDKSFDELFKKVKVALKEIVED